MPLVEIRPRSSGHCFDYEAKYTPGGSEEICPAPIDAALTARIQALALAAHHGLGCWGVSRSDFMVRDGEPFILETNTLPGLTEASLLPQAVRAAGLMLPAWLDHQVELGLFRLSPPTIPRRSWRGAKGAPLVDGDPGWAPGGLRRWPHPGRTARAESC